MCPFVEVAVFAELTECACALPGAVAGFAAEAVCADEIELAGFFAAVADFDCAAGVAAGLAPAGLACWLGLEVWPAATAAIAIARARI